MALKLIEGFDHLQYSLLNAKAWTQTLSGSGSSGSVVAGRLGGMALRLTGGTGLNGDRVRQTKILPSSYSTLVAGFGMRITTNLPSSSPDSFAMQAGATDAVRVYVNDSHQLEVRNSGGTVIATGATVLALGSWYYIEVKAVIAGASGSIEVTLNGAVEIATTTGNFGSSNLDRVYFQGGREGSTAVVWDFDDAYVLDTTGSAPNNDLLGDVRVETLYPSADGAHSQWTPDSGSDHFSRVNEHGGTYPDGDTSFVSDLTVGDRDSYACDDLTALTGSVFGVQTNLYARKDDAGSRQLNAVVRRSGADYDGAAVTLGTSYADYTEIRETDPSTSSAWAIAGVNAAEFGVKVAA